MKSKIETSNKFVVGGTVDGRITVFNPPIRAVALTPDDALLLAAYLVLMAEAKAGHAFADVYEAVSSA